MARNQEKAQAFLNRFLSAKADREGHSKPVQRRPFLATECNDLNEADKWRQQILREIGRKVMEIQNAGLGEHRLRDINDEINKLIREKGHWEKRIVELGGPNYAKTAPKDSTDGSSEVEGATGKGAGYRYFGAAKNLPGVKELFQKQAPRTVRRTRHQMFLHINAQYYGFRDDEDGILVDAEKDAEHKMRGDAIRGWEEKESEKSEAMKGVSSGLVVGSFEDEEEGEATPFIAHVPLPDKKDIEQAVLDKKKKDLLARYASSALVAQEEEAKSLLNKKPRTS
mmetsp:Transcript_5766/g.6626  ORF Transcript_5766/g.6626 Transcript_5766/m.6626 type:complete len:282 (-) Transcript_5766:316-1161(-)|eukprot:CAMPEP_0197862150 /NCGR_PEP_ID=MMETSP1438-20131217/38713_1 /TAXON_ID=1461541 /ORGANISM="Pterosperma sp., Strain CCMP1384" /LENGTH=281 /DNA_ID=CAMNT_0043479611 /DNA_START=227 /DNA_END=1072 /DNA_ORIENTATION=+